MKTTIRAGVVGASQESIYAIQEARARGIYTVAVDGSASAQGLPYADRSAVVDLNVPDLLVAFFEDNPVDFLLPVPVGRILTASGLVNDHFSLPGISKEAAMLSTDKWEFHVALASQGLRDAEAILIKKGETASRLSEMHYPVVLKPRFGSGSRAVKVYRSYNEVCRDISEQDALSAEEDFVAETCKGGTEYGADVFVINNTPHLILLREKILTPEPYRQCVGYFAIERSAQTEALLDRACSLLSDLTEVLRLDHCLMHADIMDNGSESFVIEVSPRPSGHYLHNYFTRYATQFDMLDCYIDYTIACIQGEEYKLDYTYRAQGMMIKYFDLAEGIVSTLPDPEAINNRDDVICYQCNLRVGESIGRVTDGRSVMGRGFYVVRASTIEKALEICKSIESQIVIQGGQNE